jgi:uncharacterized membrane protein
VFGLTTLGVVHTAVSLVAVSAGLVELVRHGAISPARRTGRIYVAATLFTCITGFGIFQHGGFGKPHALGVITLVVVAVAELARRTTRFGRASEYVATLLYTLTYFFHMVPGITESLTRLPGGKPLASGPDDPLVLRWVGVSLALFVVGAALQVVALRARRRREAAARTEPRAAST